MTDQERYKLEAFKDLLLDIQDRTEQSLQLSHELQASDSLEVKIKLQQAMGDHMLHGLKMAQRYCREQD